MQVVSGFKSISRCACVAAALVLIGMVCPATLFGQARKDGAEIKEVKISPELFGLFFEDINYSADGGLYAELVQNRSFEYNPAERKDWHSFFSWEYFTPGYSFGAISVETTFPVHPNNPHYIVLDAEHIGNEAKYTGQSGVGLKNSGFDGTVVRDGEHYSFSVFARQLSDEPVSLNISLQTPKGGIIAENTISTSSREWKRYAAGLTANITHDTASLVILVTTPGKVALDVVSLFPEKTFKNRPNGMRQDMAQVLADMKPKFMRFPGGCLVHGDGLGNMYRWKNTIGPIEQRVEQRNIWGYHQTAGLGYFEYFQFCEDIGAKPLPVLPAGVSCQNSGGTWRIGGTGQKAFPLSEMADYIQEVLDLIEWANGPANSTWGAKRAAAGHPEPFKLEYLGIGNEDKITLDFEERFKMIYDAVKKKYPQITVIGTAGPFPDGEDFTKGWAYANGLNVPMIDEHYYKEPRWFTSNQYRYDTYDRKKAQVYLGEYASWGNKVKNAIAEALYMISLERNGDVVRMASYAPLFAKKNHTQWTTDLIFFDNRKVYLTPNYHVQKMFSANQGDVYYKDIVALNKADSTLAASCVRDTKTGDLIVKLVNAGDKDQIMKIDLSGFKGVQPGAHQVLLTGPAESENTFDTGHPVTPTETTIKVARSFDYKAPPMSLTMIRIKTKR